MELLLLAEAALGAAEVALGAAGLAVRPHRYAGKPHRGVHLSQMRGEVSEEIVDEASLFGCADRDEACPSRGGV